MYLHCKTKSVWIEVNNFGVVYRERIFQLRPFSCVETFSELELFPTNHLYSLSPLVFSLNCFVLECPFQKEWRRHRLDRLRERGEGEGGWEWERGDNSARKFLCPRHLVESLTVSLKSRDWLEGIKWTKGRKRERETAGYCY